MGLIEPDAHFHFGLDPGARVGKMSAPSSACLAPLHRFPEYFAVVRPSEQLEPRNKGRPGRRSITDPGKIVVGPIEDRRGSLSQETIMGLTPIRPAHYVCRLFCRFGAI